MATPKKRIPQFQETFNPILSGFTVYDDGQKTYKISLQTLINLVNDSDYSNITGGTYDGNTGEITLTNTNGELIIVTGITQNTKHWLKDTEKILKDDETIVISGDYVLENSSLTLETSDTNISNGNLVFNKNSQIFIDGFLVIIDSDIINNGKISVGKSIILLGNSTITGTGIII
jgi:ribosomal protein L24